MKETRKVKVRTKWSVALILAIAILTSNMSVYAASQAVAEAYVGYYEETNEADSEMLNTLTEYEEFVRLSTKSNMITIEGEILQENRSVSNFEWTVNPNVKMCGSYFSCNEGDQISILVNVDPDDAYIRVGIERADGYKRYVYSKDRISHTFEITADGIWRIYVENTSQEAVTVEGSYIR